MADVEYRLMCGLCGVLAPEINYERMEIFQHLMAVSVLRGEYGGGFAAIPHGNKPVEIRKDPNGTAAELVFGADFYSIFGKDGKKKFSCMMGHSRLPTNSSYGLEAMHPHVHGDIIGCHNGTMKVVAGTPVNLKTDLDSSLFFKSISERGVSATIQTSEGAYALSWINRAADTVSFLRNAERQLWFAKVEGDAGLYWASERGMLQFVLARKFGNKDIRHFNLNPDTVISFRAHPQGSVDIFSHQVLTKAKENVVPFSPTGPRLPNTEYATPVRVRRDDHTLAKIVVYNFEQGGRKRTYAQNFLEPDDLQYALEYGCDNCLEPAAFADYDKGLIHWFEPKKFMCQTCLDHDKTAQEYYTSHGIPLPGGVKSLMHTSH